MSRRTEIQVGFTILAALAILLWGVTWLKDFTINRNVHRWVVRFPQTGGLGRSDEVQVNGIRKGAVERIALAGDEVVITLALDKDVVLTTDSRVVIRNVGLMGEKVIAVDLRTGGRAYTPRDTIQGEYEKGIPEVMAAMGDAVGTVEELTRQLAALAAALNQQGDFAGTLRNLKHTSEEMRHAVAENRAALRATVANFQAASKTARALTADRETELRRSLDHFASAAEKLDRVAGRMDSLRASLQSVTDKIDRGEGSLGRLVNDDRLYGEARASIASLRTLIEDIKANPKKYLKVEIF
uniref:MCE family protein n=1 Tax=Eiseniibacteriota bacterium TaxID=2212470 RepID=A0A832I2U5_UNCEI